MVMAVDPIYRGTGKPGKEGIMAQSVSPADAVAHWMAAQIPKNLRGDSRDPVEIINHARAELIRRQQAQKDTPKPDHPRK